MAHLHDARRQGCQQGLPVMGQLGGQLLPPGSPLHSVVQHYSTVRSSSTIVQHSQEQQYNSTAQSAAACSTEVYHSLQKEYISTTFSSSSTSVHHSQ